MYTRKQYMAKEVTHQEYYEQFGQHLIALVANWVGEDRIKASTDESFNDIPLSIWDAMAPNVRQIVGRSIADANGTGGISLSDCVCAAKAAARMIREDRL